MARKFTPGRQNEQLLNKEMHDLFMSIKYLNNGPVIPKKETQADIPSGALWVDSSYGGSILKIYNQTKGWNPVFEGFYHPANTQVKPTNPANGQIWIDRDNNDLLQYYDANTGTWMVPKALPANESDVGISGFENFIHIYPHVPSLVDEETNTGTYLVPNEYYGKLFDGTEYIHPTDEEYSRVSDISMDYKDKYDDQKQSWIHVNAKNLYIIEKKFAQINKDLNSADPYGIDISPKNTEFYGIKKGTNTGKLLNYVKNNNLESDYSITSNGIKLNPRAYEYDYIYAITYGFINARSFGKVIRNDAIVKEENQIYIGKFRKHPLIFLDGLYLEQDYYNYDMEEGVITLINDKVIERMDMLAIIFPDIGKIGEDPIEYSINQNNVSDNQAIVGPVSENIQKFKHPVALVSGIAGGTPQVNILDEVTINQEDFTATINGVGVMTEGDEFKAMFIDIGDAFIESGEVAEDNSISNDLITIEKNYLVFIDGLLMSPSDYEISPGKINIHGLLPGIQYILMEAGNKAGTGVENKPLYAFSDEDNKKEELLVNELNENIQTQSSENLAVVCYDAAISYYTLRIDDGNENSIYNDCDTAVVFANGGALVDEAAVLKTVTPKKGVYGQIVKLKTMNLDGSFLYKYKQWSNEYNNWIDIEDEEFINEIESMITYFSSRGSISIINNRNLLNKKITYYAYTYANTVDEPLLYGNRVLSIPVQDHEDPNQKNEFYTDFDHTFKPNVGSLTTYVNQLLVENVEHELDDGGFTVPIITSPTLIDYKKVDKYDMLNSLTEDTDYDDLGLTKEEFEKHLELKRAIIDEPKQSKLHYIVERVEEDELVACVRETISLESRNDMYANEFTTTTVKLIPGVVSIYLNGTLLEPAQYSILDEHNFILHFDVTGGHRYYDRENEETWNTLYLFNDEGELIEFPCLNPDYITIESREDYKLKRQTIEARRNQFIFSVADDGLYTSMINSKDHIKIYLDGLLYDGEYKIDNLAETITLLDKTVQNTISADPIETYFYNYPNEYIEYQKEHGKYIPKRTKVTFEWR